MIIAIPHVPARADFKKLAAAIETHGHNENHILIFTAVSGEDNTEASDFFERVKPYFRKAFMAFLPLVDVNSGYSMANTHFAVAARWASGYQPEVGEIGNPPVLFLDPLYAPNESNWADSIQSSYLKSGGRVFGDTESVENQVVPGGIVIDGGKRFIGPVVFDQKFGAESSLINYLRPDELWRTTLRWEMLQSHSETKMLVEPGVLKAMKVAAPKASPAEETTQPTKPTSVVDSPVIKEVESPNGVRRIELE